MLIHEGLSAAAAFADVEAALRSRGILAADERFFGYREVRQYSRAGGESYGAVFAVSAADGHGRPMERIVYAKAVVTGFGVEGAMKTVQDYVARFRTLDRWGIRIPLVYGHDDGVIYMEWIDGTAVDPAVHAEEMARIAAILDFHGAAPLGFLDDLLQDPEGRIVYVDVGCDLGAVADGVPPNSEMPAKRALVRAFSGAKREAVEKSYAAHVGRLQATNRQGVLS